jgi:hypothetical protein
MLDITFTNPSGEPKTCQSVAIHLDDQSCVIDGPDSAAVAETRGSMWWIDGAAFATAEIRGRSLIRFESGPTLGPFEELKLLADSLYAQGVMLARRQRSRWLETLNNKEYEKIVISPVAP